MKRWRKVPHSARLPRRLRRYRGFDILTGGSFWPDLSESKRRQLPCRTFAEDGPIRCTWLTQGRKIGLTDRCAASRLQGLDRGGGKNKECKPNLDAIQNVNSFHPAITGIYLHALGTLCSRYELESERMTSYSSSLEGRSSKLVKNDQVQSVPAAPAPAPAPAPKLHPDVLAAQAKDVISLLLLFRFLNALCVCTFFQPDEYFQALEPAWSIAFGRESGAWLTWVIVHPIRIVYLPLFPPELLTGV